MGADLAPSLLASVIARGLALDGDTDLRLSAFNSASGVTLTVTALVMRPDGCVQKFSETHIPNTNRTVSSKLIPMCGGWLLSAQVAATAGTPRRGQCFVRLELVKGLATSFQTLGTIAQGYVQDTTVLAYPGSPIRSSIEGPGVIRLVTGTDPAAGIEISETVPTNARWRLLSMIFQFVTSATVINRGVCITFDDGATVYCRNEGNFAHGASTSAPYTCASWGHAGGAFGTSELINLADQRILQGGHRINTATQNLQVGDNYGAPQMLVEEWIED